VNEETHLRASYVFVAPHPERWLKRLAMLASLVGLCIGATLTVSDFSYGALLVTVVSAGCLVVLWALLQAKIPQRITIKGAVVQIRRDGHVDSFDLEDPSVEIRVMDGEIAFSSYMERWVVVRARDVDWHVFTEVVMHYQDKADRHAEARDKRFSA
jgi:hypothetical protein